MVMTQPDWHAIRNQFPVTRNYIYFNHAAIAPISMAVRDRIAACLQKYCEYGIVCNREFLALVEQTRGLAAQLICAQPSEIAFIKNTTQGILLAAHGIRWNEGDNILVPDNEFPANVYPWLNLASRGVEVKFVSTNGGRFSVADIRQHIDRRTRAVSVSAVSFLNGFRCDLAEIGKVCKNNGLLFIVDGIQALGAVEVDVKESHIDVLSADAHKWLLGPQGIGIFYVSEEVLDHLDVSNLGWKSMQNESDYLDYAIQLKPGAARFEEGTRNIASIMGLRASLQILLELGIHNIQERILSLTHAIVQGLLERGYTVKSSVNANERSGILSFCHSTRSIEEIHDSLYRAQVVCAQRGNAIRISPHFYNNTTDIRGFLDALL